MRARVGDLRLRIGAVVVAVSSVLSVGTIAAALPGDAPFDPFGLPANGDPLENGSRPGTTVQTKTPPPPPTTTTTTTTTLPPPPPTVPTWVLPSNSGSGRRVVYSKSRQRVWAVNSNGSVAKTHLVSGKMKWCDPRVGEYRIFSRSRYTNSIQNPAVKWGYMIRFTKGCEGGNIGFHEIPKKYGVPLQSIWQLGTPLSAGCVRQGPDDARWMWNWAWVGTKVVVLP
jgi:lipoprotein-anchoring transpeptidase ErfK/SrfK